VRGDDEKYARDGERDPGDDHSLIPALQRRNLRGSDSDSGEEDQQEPNLGKT
jgi:hypothetical protein